MAIPVIFLEQLSDKLAAGHRQFGLVKPRAPYRKKEDDDGDGTASFKMETHPLLGNVPEGASNDLTAVVSDNRYSEEEALKRVEELCPQLQKQPAAQLELGQRYGHSPPSPSPLT